MFEKLKSFFAKLGVKLGMIKEINEITEHRKVYADQETYDRIELNKQIYQGYVPDWHDLSYMTSNGLQKTRKMLSLRMGKVSAKKMSKLIFNEKCQIDVATRGLKQGEENPVTDKAKEFVLQVLADNNFYRNFERYLEYCYALGGMAVKAYSHNGKIKLAYAIADSLYPLSNDSENIDEVLFIYEETKDKYFYTLLEWHEWEGDRYFIRNELYRSDTKKKLGVKVKLSELYENLEEETEFTNLSRPLFVYFKPNTANNIDLQSPLGISLYENSHDVLYSLDTKYDFFKQEFDLGKRRIVVDHSMIKPYIDEDGNVHRKFDINESVFVPLGADEEIKVTDLTVPIRADDIIKSINADLDLLAMQMGFSPGTFTFDGKSVKTATEVVSEKSETYQTKNSHEVLVEQGIKELVQTILEVGMLCKLYSGATDVDVTVDFDDSVADDRQENYNYYSMGVKDKLIPRTEAIQRIYKVTLKQAEEWIEQIKLEEQGETIPDEILDLIGVPARNIE